MGNFKISSKFLNWVSLADPAGGVKIEDELDVVGVKGANSADEGVRLAWAAVLMAIRGFSGVFFS